MSRPRIAIIASIGLMVLVVAGYFALGSAQASHWDTSTTYRLRNIQHAILIAGALLDEMPPTILALIWRNDLSPEILFTYRSERSPADVHIGNTSLQAFLDLPWDEARSFVLGIETESEWELVGDFLVGRSIWRDNDSPPNLVEGISVTCPFHKAQRAIIYADRSVELIVGTAWISTQNQLRSELGLSPIPELP